MMVSNGFEGENVVISPVEILFGAFGACFVKVPLMVLALAVIGAEKMETDGRKETCWRVLRGFGCGLLVLSVVLAWYLVLVFVAYYGETVTNAW
eukprot:CAMPEP_0114980172 /NCGR_PEP_ID=MMETSP0216-20121206/4809_1 /TAXON_ID=223996 /ORGANISM="Protocruzia adherens, Strain Boccale" /LENGTH=93 /DNA_ID=CAMNT_0002341639 /DNA_START=434 /DNA_END=712 /DNA_ORIENTATION=-